jgi:hypothetical protein
MKKKRPQPRWNVTRQRLPDHHQWNAPPGYKIFVADRGAWSFNFPETWVIATLGPPIELRDSPPPDEKARIMVTTYYLPKDIDWSGLPLLPMLEDAVRGTDRKYPVLEQGKAITEPRPDIELVWLQNKFMDPVENRPAFSRMAVARGYDLQLLITMDFWESDYDKHAPTWDEVLRSLQMGRFIKDPLLGDIQH